MIHKVFFIIFLFTGYIIPQPYPGMGGAFIDRDGQGTRPGKVIPGSITIVRIGQCWSLSTIDSTSHGDQGLRVGEKRYLPYVIQNQGNIRDSIAFSARADHIGTVRPMVWMARSDSTVTGPALGVWLEPGQVCTALVRIEIPFENLYAPADSFTVTVEVKDRMGTGVNDGWPGSRTVIREGGLFTPGGLLTDHSSVTGNQDHMVNRFKVTVAGAVNPLANVNGDPGRSECRLYSGQAAMIPVTVKTPDYFADKLSFRMTGTDGLPGNAVLLSSSGEEIDPEVMYLKRKVVVSVTAGEDLTQSHTGTCALTVFHPAWGSKKLTNIEYTIEPVELATVDKTKAQVLSLGPNPFREEYRIRYFLPVRQEVTVTIYGMGSTPVTVLEKGRKGGGIHELAWDGTGADGQKYKPGIYFCEVRMGAVRRITRLMMFR